MPVARTAEQGVRTRRKGAWTAWFICLVTFLFLALGLVLDVDESDLWSIGTLTSVVVGALIASRRPTHPIGWLFCLFGFVCGFEIFVDGYASYVFGRNNASLLAVWLAWAGSSLIPLTMSLFLFILLLFPDGRLPSPGWKAVSWLFVGVTAVGVVANGFLPGPLGGTPQIRNPLGLLGAEGQLKLAVDAFYLCLIPFAFASAISLVVRFRGSGDVEQQQLKWIAFSGAVVATAFGFTVAFDPTVNWWAILFLIVSYALFPVVVGVAILKYRLYDIDLLINKALVYALLTGSLAFVYFGSIISLQQLFRTITGQESQLAVVASTLAIAALFNPLRQRIQGFIDHRFYRRKYDAQQALATFTASTRSASSADLEGLTGELVRVIEETVQPSSLSMWLREEPSATKAWREG